MKKSWIRFIACMLLLALPFAAMGAVGFLLPAQFEKTFLGEFSNRVEELYETEGEKIVIIGGSSVSFGVDAELLEETLGMPVVNFGLYATLGTKAMMDFSMGAIGEGDIIIIAPEMNAQTFSLYYNAEAMWQAVDGNFSLLSHVEGDNLPAMLGGFWRFASSKLTYFMQEGDLDPDGIYNAASFNEKGFIRYRRDRDYNIMAGEVDATMPIDFDTSIVSADFIDYVNEYIAAAEKKGATVYMDFCPMNELALPMDLTLEDLDAFVTFLDENLDCEIIGDPNNMIYRSGYFFDSNFHLNSVGATLHTKQLALDIAPILGGDIEVKIDVPKMPEIPKEEISLQYDENEKYFLFEEKANGAVIVGVSDLGKAQTVLTTPVAYNGKKVLSLSADAFAGCDALTELFITDNIVQIPDGTFRGADGLLKIHVLATDPNMTTVNNLSGGARDGLSESCCFYVPKGALDAYKTNYFWNPYAAYMIGE